MRLRYLFFLCVFGLTGCISALPPQVEVTGARLVEEGPEGARVELSVTLTNPNDVSLPLPEANYTVSLPGIGSYSYADLPARVLGPNDSQSFTLPAAIATEGQPLTGQAWRASGTVTYDPDNQVRSFLTETGVPLPIALFFADGVFE